MDFFIQLIPLFLIIGVGYAIFRWTRKGAKKGDDTWARPHEGQGKKKSRWEREK